MSAEPNEPNAAYYLAGLLDAAAGALLESLPWLEGRLFPFEGPSGFHAGGFVSGATATDQTAFLSRSGETIARLSPGSATSATTSEMHPGSSETAAAISWSEAAAASAPATAVTVVEDLLRRAAEATADAEQWSGQPGGECLAALRRRDAQALSSYARALELG